MENFVKQFADDINGLLPNIKSGTLRFFGVWFGKPMDNWHRIVSANANGNVLTIIFNEGEVLEVSEPKTCLFSSSHFEIRNAQRVLWKWHYYGRPKTDGNLYYYDFEFEDKVIRMKTNVDWFTEKQVAQITEPAIRIY
jgi:hypothetical protein